MKVNVLPKFCFDQDVTDKPIDEDSNMDAITHTTQAVTQMAPRNGEHTVKGCPPRNLN